MKSKILFPFIFFLSLFVFIAHLTFTKTAIYSDARFYFAITRSIVKDHDIKFANEYKALGMDPAYTQDNYSWNKYPPGAPLLWLPGVFIAEEISNIVNFFCNYSFYLGCEPKQPLGWNRFKPYGFEIIYQLAVAATSILLAVLGLYLVYKILREYFSDMVSTLTILALFAATNLLFYIAVEPVTPHATSFFISSLFIYYFLTRQKDKYYYFILGLIGGFAGLVRTQDLLILTIPLIKIILSHKNNLKKLTSNILNLTSGTLLGFLPQIYFWKKIFGTFWYSPYLQEGFDLLHPHIIYVLFNFQNGLITITPIIAVALFGILALKLHSTLRFYSLAYFLLQLYIISSWSSFYQGGSFGIRMMVTTYPLLSLGLGSVIKTSLKRFGTKLCILGIFLFSITNPILIIRYLLLF